MTVKELIEKLQKFDQDTIVLVYDCGRYFTDISPELGKYVRHEHYADRCRPFFGEGIDDPKTAFDAVVI